jgi:hypothetical protein
LLSLLSSTFFLTAPTVWTLMRDTNVRATHGRTALHSCAVQCC